MYLAGLTLAMCAGLALAILASRRTLTAARSLAELLGLSPILIGMTIVAFGTDLPEIANSITASATGHGDVNVGDSIGSTVTQITLVMGILCLMTTVRAERRVVAIGGLVMVIALGVGALLMTDNQLGRSDGIILMSFWLIGSIAVQRGSRLDLARQASLFERGVVANLGELVVGLGGVALGSVVAVWAFTAGAEDIGVPEYATSFLVLSIGTSLPELIVDGRAIRSGEGGLALGGIIGSSFLDATVSLGIGPALFPVEVSSDAVRGSFIAMGIVTAAILILLSRAHHGRRSGVALLVTYAVGYVLIVA